MPTSQLSMATAVAQSARFTASAVASTQAFSKQKMKFWTARFDGFYPHKAQV
jgi:hypothetical protein